MAIYTGSTELVTAYAGATELDKIYVGSDEVWANIPAITPGGITYALTERGNESFFGFLTNPSQTADSITLYHGFYNSGSFFLVTQRALATVTLKAGSYRLHYTMSNLLSVTSKSTFSVSLTGAGTTSATANLVDGSTLTAGAKTLDFTQNSDNTLAIQFDSGLITGGTGSTDDRRATVSNIYLEKL